MPTQRQMLLAAVGASVALFVAGCASQDGIRLRDMGSFHVGGREVTLSGKPVKEVVFTPGGVPAKVDPNGTYLVESMYVQYYLPAERRGAVPLLMWHGGGLTGVTYETTPDGRDGWLNWFVKRGWDVYNSDAVERGRAGFAMYPEVFTSEPLFLPKDEPFGRFRMKGSQFPVDSYDNFVRQVVPRWTTTDAAIIAAYTQLVDKVCPCVILFHSQAGQFGFKVAQARPDKVKALVAIEPAGIGDPKRAAALKGIPTLAVFGDNIALDARWPQIRKNDDGFFDEITKAGGKVEVLDLPKAGMRGNSHMLMMDKNNLQVAALIQEWLAKQGLVR